MRQADLGALDLPVAIKHAAFDFILKPIDPDELIKAIARFRNIKEKESLKTKLDKLACFLEDSHLKFSTHQGFSMINPNEIIYCEANGNYTTIYLNGDRKEVISQQVGHIESRLDNQLFIRINRSLIINIRFIKAFDRKRKVIELKGDKNIELKVSKNGLKKLINM